MDAKILYFDFIILFTVFLGIYADVSINSANEDVNITKESSTLYTLSMNENNHVWKDGDVTPLFIVKGADSCQTNYQFTSKTTFIYYTKECTFYANQSFDYENHNQRKFSILGSIDNMLITLNFNIINIDDEPPTLKPVKCSFDEFTDYDVTTSECYVLVKDPDEGFMSKTIFSLGEYNEAFKVEFNGDMGDRTEANATLYPLEQLAYNVTNFYSFTVTATDSGGQNDTQDGTIRVVDLRNTKPVWSPVKFEQFPEKTVQQFTVFATDGDLGLHEEICYTKIDEQDAEANYIHIEDKTGVIHVNNIDRDKDDIITYSFNLNACVCNNNSFCTSQSVTYYITDVDDNPPKIMSYTNIITQETFPFDDIKTKMIKNVSFLENYAGEFNFTILIEDIDMASNAQYTVVLVKNTVEVNDALFIVPTAGYKNETFQISVKNSSYLDYENDDWKAFTFQVVSNGIINRTMTDSLTVDVHLIDYNDEVPVFSQTEYFATVKETISNGEYVIKTPATDRDAEDKDKLKMAIKQSYASSRLHIDSKGVITVKFEDGLYFDFDFVNPVLFQVTATDNADPPHVTTASVTINLTDVNNKAPTIDPVDPISVEENQKDGTILNTTISANDIDSDAKLTATINWDASYATKNSMKLDKTNDIKFLETVIDPPDGGRRISIKLKVIDSMNNSKPTKPDFETFDTVFLNLTVTDLMADKDFLYNQNTSVSIVINIIDINDNPPEIVSEDNINRTVTELTSAGIEIGSLSAFDPDLCSKNITFNCTYVDVDWVQVNAYNGSFTVIGNISADIPPRNTFNYTCQAFDGDFYSEKKEVSFYIIDTNNQNPSVEIDKGFELEEESPKNTYIARFNPTDLDRDIPFHVVGCQIVTKSADDKNCFDKFYIADNLNLTVLNGEKDIDRDGTGWETMHCTMSCRDNIHSERGGTVLFTSATFTITLKDKNDNPPELTSKEITCSESIEMDEEIGVISGTDLDKGVNSNIYFTIVNVTSIDGSRPDLPTSLFKIEEEKDYVVSENERKVHLKVTDKLKDHYGTYNVSMELHDGGVPRQNNTGNFTLIINKYAFEGPTIEFPEANAEFIFSSDQDYNKPLKLYNGSYLPDFQASDGTGEGQCSKYKVLFKIDKVDENMFTLVPDEDNCKARLKASLNFDPAEVIKKKHTFKLIASLVSDDSETIDGSGSSSTSTSITLIFIDSNEQPSFGTDSLNFTFREKDKEQKEPLPNPAHYITADGRAIYYKMVPTDDGSADYFNIEKLNGTVSLKQEISYDDYQNFSFQIVASNAENVDNKQITSYLNVIVTVDCINWRWPVFTQDSFFGAINPTAGPGTIAVQINATDPDAIDKGTLKYSISSEIIGKGKGISNLKDPFAISTKDDAANINIEFLVDNTMDGYFEFNVTVSDHPDKYKNGPHKSNTSVTVFIIKETNRVTFRFINSQDEFKDKQTEALKIISDYIKYSAYFQDMSTSNETGQLITNIRLFFINKTSTGVELVSSDVILDIVQNLNTYTKLSVDLRKLNLILLGFDTTGASTSTEEKLRNWLYGVSSVMGLLCIILLIGLVWKTKQLQRRISKLTTKQFGSQESGLNRLGVNAPTTNKHAMEGTNPIYKNEQIKKPKGMADFDNHSMRSGDSELVGVENNPEFDYHFDQHNKGA